MSSTKRSTSKQSPVNGTTSRGAKARRSRAYLAAQYPVLFKESPSAYAALRADTIARWAPRDAYELALVDDIVACDWLIARLRRCADEAITNAHQHAGVPVSWKEAVLRTESDSTVLLRRRIRAAVRERADHIVELKISKQVPTGAIPSGAIPQNMVLCGKNPRCD